MYNFIFPDLFITVDDLLTINTQIKELLEDSCYKARLIILFV